jgi:hypothetical protein
MVFYNLTNTIEEEKKKKSISLKNLKIKTFFKNHLYINYLSNSNLKERNLYYYY